jgi:hypothetical protein
MSALNIEHLHLLLLARIAAWPKSQPQKKRTSIDLAQDLESFAQDRFSAAEWREGVDGATRQLLAEGHLEQNESAALSCTEKGKQQLRLLLGLAANTRWPNWKAIKDNYLPCCALGLAPGDPKTKAAIAPSRGSIKGPLLRNHFQLPIVAMPTASLAFDAIICQYLGVSSERLTLPKLKGLLLSRALGLSSVETIENASRSALIKASGAHRADVASLKQALVSAWLASTSPTKASPAAVAPQAPPAPLAKTPAFDLATFAFKIKNLAHSAYAKRFGENKVFICSLWDMANADRIWPNLTETEFKQKLIEANRAGLLKLSRADLVAAMDAALVARSEITYLLSRFHFVEC